MVKLIATVFLICIAIAVTCALILYHQKTHASQVDEGKPDDPAAAALNSHPDSTNTAASSLSPLPAESSSN